jgi:hypothetical protein
MDRNTVTRILNKLNIPKNRNLTYDEVEAFKKYFLGEPNEDQ